MIKSDTGQSSYTWVPYCRVKILVSNMFSYCLGQMTISPNDLVSWYFQPTLLWLFYMLHLSLSAWHSKIQQHWLTIQLFKPPSPSNQAMWFQVHGSKHSFLLASEDLRLISKHLMKVLMLHSKLPADPLAQLPPDPLLLFKCNSSR